MARARSWPRSNIFWKNITPAMCVVDRGRYFEVRAGRKRAVAFWGSQDARAAQAFLQRRAVKGCKK